MSAIALQATFTTVQGQEITMEEQDISFIQENADGTVTLLTKSNCARLTLPGTTQSVYDRFWTPEAELHEQLCFELLGALNPSDLRDAATGEVIVPANQRFTKENLLSVVAHRATLSAEKSPVDAIIRKHLNQPK